MLKRFNDWTVVAKLPDDTAGKAAKLFKEIKRTICVAGHVNGCTQAPEEKPRHEGRGQLSLPQDRDGNHGIRVSRSWAVPGSSFSQPASPGPFTERDKDGLRLEKYRPSPVRGQPTDGDLGPEGTQVPEKGKTRPSDSPAREEAA